MSSQQLESPTFDLSSKLETICRANPEFLKARADHPELFESFLCSKNTLYQCLSYFTALACYAPFSAPIVVFQFNDPEASQEASLRQDLEILTLTKNEVLTFPYFTFVHTFPENNSTLLNTPEIESQFGIRFQDPIDTSQLREVLSRYLGSPLIYIQGLAKDSDALALNIISELCAQNYRGGIILNSIHSPVRFSQCWQHIPEVCSIDISDSYSNCPDGVGYVTFPSLLTFLFYKTKYPNIQTPPIVSS